MLKYRVIGSLGVDLAVGVQRSSNQTVLGEGTPEGVGHSQSHALLLSSRAGANRDRMLVQRGLSTKVDPVSSTHGLDLLIEGIDCLVHEDGLWRDGGANLDV